MQPSGVTAPVTIPFEYHNTFDYSLGVNFKANEKWTLRTGLQLMTTPSNDHDRSIQDPIGKATIVGIGAHYQANKNLGVDLGYAHSFFENTKINYSTSIAFATGHSEQNSNVVGAQITWDFV